MTARRVLAAALLLAAVAMAFVATAAEAPIPPSPTQHVTDTAGFLSSGARSSLETRLARAEEATGHQVLVWIGKSTGDRPLEDFAVKAFEAWKVGQKGKDDGVVLFILAADRKIRIEVGYGLEADLTDADSGRIIRELMAPRLAAGDQDGAVTAAVSAILGEIGVPGGEALQAARAPRAPPPMGWPGKILLALIVVGFLILLITNPSLALWLLIQIASSGRGRGGGWSGGGGGGWSGGGGRSGGGGASGGW